MKVLKFEKKSTEFIDELAKQIIDELSRDLGDFAKLQAKFNQLETLAEKSLSLSEDACNDIAYLFYFTGSFQNPFVGKQALEWLSKAYERYPSSNLLKFLYLGQLFSESVGTENIKTIKKDYEELKASIRKDHEFFIDILERAESISLYALRHENLLKVNYDLYHERIFPEATMEIFPQALSSFYHSICAEYYRIAEIIEDQEKASFRALELYENNSLAIAEVAYFKVESNTLEAENMFRKAIKLAESQFASSPKDRLFIKSLGYSGLGYLYNKRAIYDIAEKHYNEALEILQSSNFQNPFVDYLKDTILLNRGRNRLDGGSNIKGSIKDLTDVIRRNDDLAAAAKTNLGLIYYKQGLYEKAEAEFIEAIERKPDLPHPYYNLGVLYAKEGGEGDQGKIERAKKLFQTALDFDGSKGGFKEASGALREIEGSGTRKNIRDWYSWWFDAASSSYKKGLGITLLALMLSGLVLIIYQTLIKEQPGATITNTTTNMSQNLTYSTSLPSTSSNPSSLSNLSNLILGSLGIIIFFLALPLVTHLKIGSIIDLEMESKGERPLFYAGPSLSSVGQT
ncbi:MAG TPA: tetratricopeptide repeat protein [Nitrososphaeraceae archaeon]|nr:tetratricopeptide repeat protein [Nitrososphaeraceae archaeon]